MVLNDQGGERMDVAEDKTSTLRAQANHPPLIFENHGKDVRYKGPLDIAPTVAAQYAGMAFDLDWIFDSWRCIRFVD